MTVLAADGIEVRADDAGHVGIILMLGAAALCYLVVDREELRTIADALAAAANDLDAQAVVALPLT
jgi:hypothetical protein